MQFPTSFLLLYQKHTVTVKRTLNFVYHYTLKLYIKRSNKSCQVKLKRFKC